MRARIASLSFAAACCRFNGVLAEVARGTVSAARFALAALRSAVYGLALGLVCDEKFFACCFNAMPVKLAEDSGSHKAPPTT